MKKFEIKLTDNRVSIETPYEPSFVKEVKKLQGAKWNSQSRVWTVDECEMQNAVELIKNIYGVELDADKKVTVKITVISKKLNGSCRKDLVIAGATIIGDCKLSEEVKLDGSVKTKFKDGQAIRTFIEEGSVFTFETSEKAYNEYDYCGTDFEITLA